MQFGVGGGLKWTLILEKLDRVAVIKSTCFDPLYSGYDVVTGRWGKGVIGRSALWAGVPVGGEKKKTGEKVPWHI